MIIALKTDQPIAEIYLCDSSGKILNSNKWEAHRELSNTLLEQIEVLLAAKKLALKDLTGLIVFEGPGSFTGLRIGISVANTLSYSLQIPITGSGGDNWLIDGLKKLKNVCKPEVVIPNYGSEPHITKARK